MHLVTATAAQLIRRRDSGPVQADAAKVTQQIGAHRPFCGILRQNFVSKRSFSKQFVFKQ
jgi:hypothetical protein